MLFESRRDHIQYTSIRNMLSRRDFFQRIGVGLGGMALADLLSRDLVAGPVPESRTVQYDVLPKKPHFPPKAKRVILLFQNGGPSQAYLFDPKPQLTQPA